MPLGGVLVALSLALGGCTTLQPPHFAGTQPLLEPDRFFTGHTCSWGVFEDRAGANPRRPFTTECFGRRERGELILAQTFTYGDGTVQHRVWRIRRLDLHHYEAVANDVVGVGRGEAYGNAFHWEYTVALKPGNPLFRVKLKQWMYLQKDLRTLLNRGTVSVFGVTVAQVTEEFRRQP
ncbi:MAG TPA: DUF3833 family protein [Chthoniobacterales bacterium]